MRYIKIFEDFNNNQSSSFKIGDMVYVDNQIGTWLQFNKYTKYQIVYIEGGHAFLYDESNMFVPIKLNNLYKERIDFELVKDYFISSFEELFDSEIIDVNYKDNVSKTWICIKLNPDRRGIWLKRHNILYILNTEFKKRIESEGYYIELNMSEYPEHRYENIIYFSVNM